ncbi:MAG TPA: hypothetical protein VJA87_03290 [Candidatus Paceibacterota bacterium]
MCRIKINEVPRGPVPRQIRADLLGIEVEAEEKQPQTATIDFILFLDKEQNPDGYFPRRTDLCDALRKNGKHNAATYHEGESGRGEYIQIERSSCIPC